MNNKILSAACAFAITAACSATVHAQAKPDVLVKQRQSAMALQGKYFGPMAGMAQGKIPYDAGLVARNAGYLDVLAKMPWDGFTPNTKGEKTGALPAVFSEPAKFKEAADRLQTEATKLAQVSRGGDEATVKAQILAVGKTCAACHDDYREKR